MAYQSDPWEHLIAMGIGGYALEKYVEFGEEMEKKIAEKEKKLLEHKKAVEGDDDRISRFSYLLVIARRSRVSESLQVQLSLFAGRLSLKVTE